MIRADSVRGGSVVLPVPALFPSISSVKTNLAPLQYLQLLVGVNFPNFLLSAWDFHASSASDRNAIKGLVEQARQGSGVVLLDSGNYESYWHRDNAWSREKFHEALRVLDPPFAFSYDDQDPPDDVREASELAIDSARTDKVEGIGTVIVPIVHGSAKNLPEIVRKVADSLRPEMIAVPERELGDGITSRCRTVVGIRSRLNELSQYVPLHLLGTGNPHSILAYFLSGADSFDGLEWCQTSVDFESGNLSHFQNWDLFASESPVARLESVPFQQKVLAHNLVFYAELARMIREYDRGKTASRLIDRMLHTIRSVIPTHV